MNSITKLVVLLSVIVSSYTVQAQPDLVDTSMIFVSANNALISYTGRMDFRSKNDPAFSYPGTSIKLKFTGDAFDVLMQEMGDGSEDHTNYFTIIIDEGKPEVIKLDKKQRIYFLARSLDLREHTIEMIKRTESSVGAVVLHGFRLRRGHRLLPLENIPTRKIEFIGNSLTTGYGNEVIIEAPPKGKPDTGFHSIYENNYTSWGAITSRTLKAQFVCTAYSGRGLYRNNTGTTHGTLPLLYDYVTPGKADAIWNHQNFIPDVIVIDLGANDFAQGVPDSTLFCSTYISFIEKLRAIHPMTKIICVAGNSITDVWPVGENRWSRMKNFVRSVVKESNSKGDTAVFYFELTPQSGPYGEDWHPTNATHKKMADAITPFIKTITAW